MASDCSYRPPCLWARIGGSILFLAIGSVIPFTYGNVRQIDRNTQRIEQLGEMALELKANSQAIIRMTVVLENQTKTIEEIKDTLKKR